MSHMPCLLLSSNLDYAKAHSIDDVLLNADNADCRCMMVAKRCQLHMAAADRPLAMLRMLSWLQQAFHALTSATLACAKV